MHDVESQHFFGRFFGGVHCDKRGVYRNKRVGVHCDKRGVYRNKRGVYENKRIKDRIEDRIEDWTLGLDIGQDLLTRSLRSLVAGVAGGRKKRAKTTKSYCILLLDVLY